MMQNIVENMAGTLVFLAQNWRILVALAGAVGWFMNRETEDEKKRKPELIDQITLTAEARCEPQKKYPELSPLKLRLKDAVAEVRSAAFDRYMSHKITICPSQEIAEFKDGAFSLTSNDFVAAYYYNDGEPVVTLWDKGKAKKDSGFLETKIDAESKEALEKFAQQFLNSANAPATNMLAYKASKRYRCGTDDDGDAIYCTDRWIQWDEARKFATGLAKNPAMAVAPLKAEPPPVGYKVW